MRAPLTFVGEKYRKVTAVYPATDNQSCTCKLNLGLMIKTQTEEEEIRVGALTFPTRLQKVFSGFFYDK